MISFIVHGGAWDIPDDLVDAHRIGIHRALAIGWNILSNGGSAVDAVEKSINAMEDDPTFDAGRGSFVNAIGEIELDASIMNGTTFRAGAIAAVQNIRYPISLARVIMDSSEHILLAGEGAVRFAREHGIEQCSKDDLLVGRRIGAMEIPPTKPEVLNEGCVSEENAKRHSRSSRTRSKRVIVSGTSTGGTPKNTRRVGDSPRSDAEPMRTVRSAAHRAPAGGRQLLKVVLAKTVIDLMEYNGGDPLTAARQSIERLERKADGFGGVIVLNKEGVSRRAVYNTPRMARRVLGNIRDAFQTWSKYSL